MQDGFQAGQYIFLRKIGEGGMAEVWEARHALLGNRVAIKFLLPEFARNRELQERFLNEAKRQALLQHLNIVPAVDFFQADGRSFFVMKYVEGHSLEERLKKSELPLSVNEIHSISWDVLSALDYAHAQGIVHRDVKPANMLVDHSGRVLLMDFGIAKALREERSLTMTGTSMGTPDYMSPEQILEPKKVDARSDVYSFGCVLYAMLAGNPPFGSEATSPFVVQDRHVRSAPPPLVFRNPDVPAAVSAVVFKCLEKDPAARYRSCGEVMGALNAALGGPIVETASTASNQMPLPRIARDPNEFTKVDTKLPPEPAPQPTKIETGGFRRPEPPPTPPPGQDSKTAQIIDTTPKPARFGIAIVAGVAVIIVICCAAYWMLRPTNQRLKRLIAKDWSHVRYDDPDFSDCVKVQECVDRAAQASRLRALKPQDWHNLPYNSPLFDDCMSYQPCVDRNAHATQLQAVTDWHHAGKQLLADCMDYVPCKKAAPAHTETRSFDDGEGDWPNCCKDLANPAQCVAAKKKEQLPDCSSPIGQ